MLRYLTRCGALAGLVALGACKLEVTNPNQPETKRVLATPKDVESLLGAQYLRWHLALYQNTGNQALMTMVLSFEDFSSLANDGMGSVISLPRGAVDNSIGNTNGTNNSKVYNIESEVNRTASNILARFKDPAFTLGSQAQDVRAKAFGEFMRGLSLGYLALIYDSAAVVTADMSTQDAGKLSGYKTVMDSATAALQRAIDFATTTVTGSNGFPLPGTWIPGPTTMSVAEFVKLIRSYRARFRADVARTPAERAAVDWDAVIADAQNGITSDHFNTTNVTNGPFNGLVNQLYAYSTWHQMTPFVIGMADGSDGAFAAWIALPLDARGAGNTPFFMVSPDLRFPQGATRGAQQADFAISSCEPAATVCKRYFVNRATGSDQLAGASWGWSNYDHARFRSWRVSGDGGTARNGNFPFFTKAELDMLQAEGLIRKGSYAAAGALINITRVGHGGLPAITVFDATTPVPGDADCVPKVPVGPTYNTVACGNLLEAMKYEKRIEEAYTHFAAWYLDERGWGDLAQNTALHWATPYQDLQARYSAAAVIYSTGGGTNPASAAKGTYGW
jgi:hypothetical protein